MSTRDELEKAAEWFEELSSYHSNPTLMAKEKLAATALREKASAVEGFEAWAAQKQKEQATPLYNYDLTICREAYAAGHAAASVRVAELEAELAPWREIPSDVASDLRQSEHRMAGTQGALIRALEAERTLLVAEVRRCWGLAASESSGLWVMMRIERDKPAEVRAIVEAQP